MSSMEISLTMKPEKVWQAALGELQLQMTKATFDTWVKQTHVVAYEDGTFIIGVQNGYAKDWLDNRLMGTVKRTLAGILNRSVEVRFTVHTPTIQAEEPVTLLQPKATPLHLLRLSPATASQNLRLTLNTRSINSSSAARTGWLTLPRWLSPRTRPRPITPCSFTAAWGWAKPTSCRR